APFTGLIAGAAAIRMGTLLDSSGARLAAGAMRPLAALWLWPLVLFVAWFPGGWIFGHLFPSVLLRLGLPLFIVFDQGLPLVVVVSAFAKDDVLGDPAASQG
ncbi:MAG: hypothetical protein PVH41_16630, partial [Anaerolineae bacterium]